ncbi:MAG TPA: ABC transporter permease [Edaphobacter sp.]|nr:ABC transporter permease [Edaphobacter sp.]
MSAFFDKLRSLFTRNPSRNEISEEFDTHLDLLAQRFEQQGMSPSQARTAARRQFGNTALHQQHLTEMRSFTSLSNLVRDLHFAFRRLKKSPGFTLTAVLTLALGIGASTAIFSIVDGVLLKPLAYRNSGQLVVVWERVRVLEKIAPYLGPNPRHEQLWRNQPNDFSNLAVVQTGAVGVSLNNADHPRFVGQVNAQPSLLETLGIQPALGRNFLSQEAEQKSPNTAIISWNLWQSLFHGDSNAIGKTILLGTVPNTIIGVLPKDFYFPKPNELTFLPHAADLPAIDVITPLPSNFSNLSWDGDYGDYIVLGRLKPGATIEHAQSQLDTFSKEVLRQMPPGEQQPGSISTYIQPMKDVIVGKSTRSLWLLFAAVLSVLLIACVNLANAQLARAIAGERESAVRSALGASAWSLLQTSLAEVALLSIAGGAIGVALACFAVRAVPAYTHLALARTESLYVNPCVLSFSLLITLGSTLLFGLLPSLRMLRIRPQQALQNNGRSFGSLSGTKLRPWLIGLQIFACCTLLLVAGLFTRSLVKLLTTDKGFSSQHIVIAEVDLGYTAFPSSKRLAFENAVLERLRSLPGVNAAALINAPLLNGESNIDPVGQAHGPWFLANYRRISSGYFTLLGQRILEGRDFEDRDRTASNVLISETTAKTVFPNQVALGRQIKHDNKLYTVIGIVSDAHNTSLRANPVNMVYIDYREQPPSGNFFLVRGSQDTALLADAVRKAIWSYDPTVTIAHITSLDSRIHEVLSSERLETTILSAFGASALLLALLGIYGTLSYTVTTRRQEIGVRIALGATRSNVCRVMLQQLLTPLIAGLILAWLASLAIGRTIASRLYEAAPGDATVTLSVLALFFLASTAATIVPCRQAATINPTEALRSE